MRLVKLDLPVMQQFHELLDTSAKVGRKESMNYIFHGQYMRCTLQVLAKDDHGYAGKMEYYLISAGRDKKETHRMDKLLRHLFIVYDGLYVIRKKEGLVEVPESMNRVARTGETVPLGRFLKLGDFMHPEDKKRFLRIMKPGVLEKESRGAKRSAVTDLFRMKMDDGSYRWKEFNFALLGSSWDGDILLGIKDTASAAAKGTAVLPSYLSTLGSLPEMEKEENSALRCCRRWKTMEPSVSSGRTEIAASWGPAGHSLKNTVSPCPTFWERLMRKSAGTSTGAASRRQRRRCSARGQCPGM